MKLKFLFRLTAFVVFAWIIVAGCFSIISFFWPNPSIGYDEDGEPFSRQFYYASLIGICIAGYVAFRCRWGEGGNDD
jgi:hypothetical protein